MAKLRLTLMVAVVLMAQPAFASQTINLRCANPEVANPEGDGIGASITLGTSLLDKYSKVTNFVVVHKLSGKLINRQNQYTNLSFEHQDGTMDFYWGGFFIKDPAQKMIGRAWWNDKWGWQYQEVLTFTDGRQGHPAFAPVPCKLLEYQ